MASKAHIAYFETGSWPVNFGFTTSKKNFRKEMKRINVKPIPEFITAGANATTHILSEGNAICIIVCLKKRKGIDKSQIAGLIAHEATHVWDAINDAMRGKCPGGEHHAYGLQWIVQSMANQMEEFK